MQNKQDMKKTFVKPTCSVIEIDCNSIIADSPRITLFSDVTDPSNDVSEEVDVCAASYRSTLWGD